MSYRKPVFWLIAAIVFFCCCDALSAQSIPKVSITVDDADKPRDIALGLELLFLFTVLTMAPSFLIMMSSFTRIVIVLHFIRQALGLQQMPPNQVMLGLALFMTFFLMEPIGQEIYDKAYKPYIEEKISAKAAIENAMSPLRQFMLKQTREKDLALFVNLSQVPRPNNPEELSAFVIIPSFIISELRRAFQIGFLLFIPFLMIDMIVASILMSMGMLMLPPMMISLPFKLLLFVLVDGWHLLISSVIEGFA